MLKDFVSRAYHQARTLWRVASGSAAGRRDESLDLFLTAGHSVQKNISAAVARHWRARAGAPADGYSGHDPRLCAGAKKDGARAARGSAALRAQALKSTTKDAPAGAPAAEPAALLGELLGIGGAA